MTGRGMGGHQSQRMGKDEWLTPPHITEALGAFDLDPCAPACPPWEIAPARYTAADDGLAQAWFGRVWCNPPYGSATAAWMSRCADHGNAIALIFARTETKMFFSHVWGRADALLFLRGRIAFHHVDGSGAKSNSGAPSVLVAYGTQNAAALQWCGLPGKFIPLR